MVNTTWFYLNSVGVPNNRSGRQYASTLHLNALREVLSEDYHWHFETDDEYKEEQEEIKNIPVRGMRKAMGYRDKNDGFMRSFFSRSKNDHSRNTKEGKILRIKPSYKTFIDEEIIDEEENI